eukprot:1140781-Pelagomonas_calceolata.AAC.2
MYVCECAAHSSGHADGTKQTVHLCLLECTLRVKHTAPNWSVLQECARCKVCGMLTPGQSTILEGFLHICSLSCPPRQLRELNIQNRHIHLIEIKKEKKRKNT